MRIPIGVPSCPITSMHDGIKITKNYPWDASVLGAFLRKIVPKSASVSWGIVSINKSYSNDRWRGCSSDLTGEPLSRGGDMGEGKFMRVPANKDSTAGRRCNVGGVLPWRNGNVWCNCV